ncbi:sugar phosphorylase, partial [bacterium]|nr:sugar phosphorylase [bacterium]
IVAKRFLMSQSIMLTFRGVPGIYFHSLLGSRNWKEGIDKTGHFRSINREKLNKSDLMTDLVDRGSLRSKVFYPYIEMIKKRGSEYSFHPMGKQSVLFCQSSVFAIKRISPDKKETVLCLHNLSKDSQQITIAIKDLQTIPVGGLLNILENRFYEVINGVLNIEMAPYEVLWLKTGCG